MTWAEFVRRVDAALEAKGLSRETEIDYIDVGAMLDSGLPDCPTVEVEHHGNGPVLVDIAVFD